MYKSWWAVMKNVLYQLFGTISNRVCAGPPPDACQAYVQESSVASIVAMYYTLQTARQRDRIGLMRVLGTLANCDSDRAFEDPFLHFLVNMQRFLVFK